MTTTSVILSSCTERQTRARARLAAVIAGIEQMEPTLLGLSPELRLVIREKQQAELASALLAVACEVRA